MIRLSLNLRGVQETQDGLKQVVPILMDEADSALRASLFQTTRTSQSKYLSGPRPQRLGVITNRLRGSLTEGAPDFVMDVARQALQVKGSIGTNVSYAPTHEYGAVIRPTRSKFLWIPGQNIRTPAGALKAGYQGSLRDVPDTFVRPNPRGGFLVFQRMRKATILLIGVLKSSVTIPKRPFLGPSLTDSIPWITERFTQGLRRVEQRINAALKGRR